MAIRGLVRNPTALGFATPTNCPIYCDGDDGTIKVIPAGSGTTEQAIPFAISASGAKIAAGTGAFVSGVATVATGLTSVLGFAITKTATATGPATGATEITNWGITITTGSVSVVGYRLWSITASASGTDAFTWVAVGQ